MSRPELKQIWHRPFGKAWLPIMASTVKNGIACLQKGNRRRLHTTMQCMFARNNSTNTSTSRHIWRRTWKPVFFNLFSVISQFSKFSAPTIAFLVFNWLKNSDYEPIVGVLCHMENSAPSLKISARSFQLQPSIMADPV